MRLLSPLAAAILLAAASSFAADPALENGLLKFHAGNYEEAIPLLLAEASADVSDDRAAAALLSSLVEENRHEEALALGGKLAAQFPDSAAALPARGDLAYYLGHMAEAQELYQMSVNKKENGRACLGLSKVLHAASYYRTARLLLIRAHILDPSDIAIARRWVGILPREKRAEAWEKFLKDYPDMDRETLEAIRTIAAVAKQLNGKEGNALLGEAAETTLPMERLMYDSPLRLRGWGVKFRMNGGKTMTLLIDTGASGIVINQRAADKAAGSEIREARHLTAAWPRHAKSGHSSTRIALST